MTAAMATETQQQQQITTNKCNKKKTMALTITISEIVALKIYKVKPGKVVTVFGCNQSFFF